MSLGHVYSYFNNPGLLKNLWQHKDSTSLLLIKADAVTAETFVQQS